MNNRTMSEVDCIAYDLCRHLPEIEARGCSIFTSYGYIAIEPYEAKILYKAVEKILHKRLSLARRAARDEGIASGANGANACGGAS